MSDDTEREGQLAELAHVLEAKGIAAAELHDALRELPARPQYDEATTAADLAEIRMRLGGDADA